MKTKKIICIFYLILLGIMGWSCNNQKSLEPKFVIGEITEDPNMTASLLDNSENFPRANLMLEISSDKSTYQLGEDIPVEIKLTNLGPNPTVVNRNLISTGDETPTELNTVNFIVLNARGERLPFKLKVRSSLPQDEDFVTLDPGGMPLRAQLIDINGSFDFSKCGVYTIQMKYHNTSDAPDGREAWKGLLESNIITIEIIS
jgi:hypothetical protein